MADLTTSLRPVTGLPCTEALLTYDQLHERQCIACPETSGLRPAGHQKADGLIWAVVACAEHAEAVSPWR